MDQAQRLRSMLNLYQIANITQSSRLAASVINQYAGMRMRKSHLS